jgi:hypothetical protein
MSDPIILSASRASISKPKTILSKLFRSKSTSAANNDIFPSDSAFLAEQPLVKSDPIKVQHAMENESFGNLMEKAQTMSAEEFRKYLKRHKEVEEERHRKQGGGIAGGGDWVWRGEKEVRGEYVV